MDEDGNTLRNVSSVDFGYERDSTSKGTSHGGDRSRSERKFNDKILRETADVSIKNLIEQFF